MPAALSSSGDPVVAHPDRLGWPAQAISYKLGERVWLEGREAARREHEARGETFDLRAWHMKALSLGALGLDDLATELARL